MVSIRQALHQIPEPAFAEHKTKALILQVLRSLFTKDDNIWQTTEFANSNAILVRYSPSRYLINSPYRLFRADMDALRIPETTNCAYSSTHPGYMHACGHDIHMTILLGLIEKVACTKPHQNLLFLFQPAEEGKGGAQSVLAEGIIQRYPIQSAIALHVASELPVGTVSAKPGIFFGIPQEFDIVFTGKSAHVAYPEKGINALAAGVETMRMIDAAIAELAATERIIFHIGRMYAGSVRNAVADQCTLEGTHRSLKPEVRDAINSLIIDTSEKVAGTFGASVQVELLCSYDPVVNNPALVDALIRVCQSLNLNYLPAETAMTGEDFGFFTTLYPGLLFWLGSGCDEPLHSGGFLPSSDCIEPAVKVLLALANELHIP